MCKRVTGMINDIYPFAFFQSFINKSSKRPTEILKRVKRKNCGADNVILMKITVN